MSKSESTYIILSFSTIRLVTIESVGILGLRHSILASRSNQATSTTEAVEMGM